MHCAFLFRLEVLNFDSQLGEKVLSEDSAACSHGEIIQIVLCVNSCGAKAPISCLLHMCLLLYK